MNTTSNAKEHSRGTRTHGPYSPLRQVGEFYFISGHIGADPQTGTASSDIKTQTAKVLENMAQTLRIVGLELDDVVKTTLFLTDMSDFDAVNEVYQEYFSEPRPARSTVGVKELPRVNGNTSLKIEIEAIAKAPCH
jgi:2-iminobutanoate/2-iminopropanoate deaminase